MRTSLKVLLCGLVASLTACTATDPDPDGRNASPTTAPSAPSTDGEPGAYGAGDKYYPQDGNGGYDAAGYHVDVRYEPDSGELRGVSTMSATATQDLSRFHLDLRKLKVREVRVDDEETLFRQEGQELIITPAQAIPDGTDFTVRVEYAGKPGTKQDTSGVGNLGWLTTDTGAAYALGEPHSASFWYPVNETPRDTATFKLTATVPKDWTAVSIGREGKSSTENGWTTYRWVEENPVASYLTTIAIDKFTIRRSELPSGIPVVDAYAPGAGDKQRIAERLDEVVKVLTDKFGKYPQSSAGGIYMASSIPFALETNGRPTYASWAELDVIVHEYAHQWYGNSVTLESWADICLHECVASYAEWLWHEETSNADLDGQYRRQVESAPEQIWADKLYAMGSGNEFSGVYGKGALAMHALRAEIGDKAFAKVLKGFAKKHRFDNASWPQFEDYVEKISGKDLETFFTVWFRGTTKPPERYLYPGRLGDN